MVLGRLKAGYGRPKVRRGLDAPPGLIATDVSLLGRDGGTLRGWFCRPGAEAGAGAGAEADAGAAAAGGAAGAVVLHGWGGAAADMVPVSEPLIDAGIHTLLLDARCHGRSDDAEFTSMPSFAEDLAAGVRWLRDQPGVDPDRVLVVGHSVGAGACLLAARDDPRIAAVISLSSMADPREMMTRMLSVGRVPRPLIPVSLRIVEHVIGTRFADFAPLVTLGALQIPVLLVHGDQDPVVPVEDVHRLARVARNVEVLVIPGAGHTEAVDTTVLADALRAFASRTVGTPLA